MVLSISNVLRLFSRCLARQYKGDIIWLKTRHDKTTVCWSLILARYNRAGKCTCTRENRRLPIGCSLGQRQKRGKIHVHTRESEIFPALLGLAEISDRSLSSWQETSKATSWSFAKRGRVEYRTANASQ